MTEYDYSPDAYERYMAKQQAIARWVDDAGRYPPTNPFLPSARGSTPRDPAWARDSPVSPRGYDSDSEHESPSSHNHHHHHRRDHGNRHHRHHRNHHGRSYQGFPSQKVHTRSSSSPPTSSPPSGSSYASHPYSAPYTNGYQYTTGYVQQSPYTTTTAQPHNLNSSPNALMSSSQAYAPIYFNTTNPAYVHPSSSQPLVVPIQGGTGGYVVVPAKGTSYQVVNPAQYQSSASQPWYKRVFSPTPSAKFAKSSSSGSKKRGNKWSWDIY